MKLSTAQEWVRRATRDGNDDSTYTPGDIDRAVIAASVYFCRETRCVRKATSIALTAASSSMPITALTTAGNFAPEQTLDVLLTSPAKQDPLMAVDYSELLGYAATSTSSGVPSLFAFLDPTTAAIWPAPDQNYTATLRWWQSFGASENGGTVSLWEPGAEAYDLDLNIPDAYLPEVLSNGAVSYLLSGSVDGGDGGPAGQRFAAYVARMKSAGSLGSKVINRSSVSQEIARGRGCGLIQMG